MTCTLGSYTNYLISSTGATIQAFLHYLPNYSPKLNLAAIETHLIQQLHQKVVLNQANISNILQHIQNLIIKT
jgi:hypothetical protein